jgi:hypothetical protein
MKLSEAGLKSNISYWQAVAARYQRQRDRAVKQLEQCQAILLKETGKAYDGHDWIREVARTKAQASWKHRLRNFWQDLLERMPWKR